jgi:excalibur calcium-binding domain-containing protein
VSHSLRRRLTVPLLTLSLLGFMATAQPASAFRDRDCSDFSTHAQAQRFFKKHHPNRDPHRLDADHDGIACESLP